jgi:hypothetical protein
MVKNNKCDSVAISRHWSIDVGQRDDDLGPRENRANCLVKKLGSERPDSPNQLELLSYFSLTPSS